MGYLSSFIGASFLYVRLGTGNYVQDKRESECLDLPVFVVLTLGSPVRCAYTNILDLAISHGNGIQPED